VPVLSAEESAAGAGAREAATLANAEQDKATAKKTVRR
jgi:hypothetical protein